jgi:uncharacterized protein
MLILLSPSKNMVLELVKDISYQRPIFTDEASRLAHILSKLSIAKLAKLFGVSKPLAELNHQRYQDFGTNKNIIMPTVFAFSGETYIGLKVKELSIESLTWANEHLLIFSGLYGLLRPLDTIEPYRLDIKNNLKIPKYKSLTEYWKILLREYTFSHPHSDLVLNLASAEYSSLLPRTGFKKWIDVVFLEQEGKKLVSKTVFSKRARGSMARFVIEQRITDPFDLIHFATDGYRYYPKLSKPGELVFVRKAKLIK